MRITFPAALSGTVTLADGSFTQIALHRVKDGDWVLNLPPALYSVGPQHVPAAGTGRYLFQVTSEDGELVVPL